MFFSIPWGLIKSNNVLKILIKIFFEKRYTAAMKQVFLFTGENGYLLGQEKRRWTQEFSQKYGPENLVRLEGGKLSLRLLLDEVGVAPFLSERRLVVVEGVPKFTKEELEILFNALHPQVILLFADPKPDKRFAGIKELLKAAEVKQFAVLKGKAVPQWVEHRAKELGCPIEPQATNLLLEYSGADQELLDRELTKLSVYAHGRMITRNDVHALSIPTDEGIGWRITDLLYAGQREEAAAYARRSIAAGAEGQAIWALLLSSLRNVVLVAAHIQDGVKNSGVIASQTGIHPFAVASTMKYASRIDCERLRAFVEEVASADIALKTGEHRATGEAPEELQCLIDRFLLRAP